MSERHKLRRAITLLLGLSLASAALGACGEPRDAPKPCEPSLPAEPFDARRPAITIPLDQNGALRGDPSLSQAMARTLDAATVKITHGGDHVGSGVLVDGPRGEVILTAAHVVRGRSLHELAFTAVNGHSSPGDQGCYIDEAMGGAQPDPRGDKPNANDVAVVRLQDNLPDTEPMVLATEQPDRGSWVTMQNYGGNAIPEEPKRYNGLVVIDHQEGGPAVISGVQLQRLDEGPEAYTTTSGASGGPVTCITPQRTLNICGLTVSTEPSTAKALASSEYGFGLPEAPGLQPHIDLITPVATIRHALNSPNY